MTTIGEDFPVRAKTLSRLAHKRASRPARPPASTQCLDILCPPPGTSEVISHFERLSSNEMKMAPICGLIPGGSSCGSSDIGSLQSESDRNLSLPHDRPLSTPHGIFAFGSQCRIGRLFPPNSQQPNPRQPRRLPVERDDMGAAGALGKGRDQRVGERSLYRLEDAERL